MTPWVTASEASNIKKVAKIDFYIPPTDTPLVEKSQIGRLKRGENGGCIFLTPSGCNIANVRPFDCRLFPFALLKSKQKYYLIRWTVSCPENIVWDEDLDAVLNLAFTNLYIFDGEAIASDMFVIIKDITAMILQSKSLIRPVRSSIQPTTNTGS